MEEEDDEDEGGGEVPMTSPGEEEKDEDEEEGREHGGSAGVSPVHAHSPLSAAALSFCCEVAAAFLSFADTD